MSETDRSKDDTLILLIGRKEDNPCECCYSCQYCNSCEYCYTCQDCVVMDSEDGYDWNPPDIENFIRIQKKEDGRWWLTLPQWLEKIIRILFGWWLKPPPKKK